MASYFSLLFLAVMVAISGVSLLLGDNTPNLCFVDVVILLLIAAQALILGVLDKQQDKQILRIFHIVFSLLVYPFAIFAVMVTSTSTIKETGFVFDLLTQHETNFAHIIIYMGFAFFYTQNFMFPPLETIPLNEADDYEDNENDAWEQIRHEPLNDDDYIKRCIVDRDITAIL